MQTAISIFGKDRPGIIASLTKSLADMGANIQDASMTILQGHFAMILVADFESSSRQEIQEALESSAGLTGFTISISNELSPQQTDLSPNDVTRYVFHLAVADARGIVAKVTSILGGYGANVIDCATRKNNSTGVFSMVLDVDVPTDQEQKIVEQLNVLAGEFAGDVVFQKVDDVDL